MDIAKQLLEEFKSESIPDTLRELAQRFAGKIVFSTGFGQEGQVLTDIIFSHELPIEIFTIDTGRLFNETYGTFNETVKHYKKEIRTYFPDTVKLEQLVSEKGPVSFYESVKNRKECCYIRKVEPLQRALAGKQVWITGLRCAQADGRENIPLFEWVETYRLIKYNPLARWTLKEVTDYLKLHEVPYNPLHNKGFISIGCAPCTRAVVTGENIRAGRWWWEDSKKECGLHEHE